MTHAENWAPDSWRKLTALQQPSWDENKIKQVFIEHGVKFEIGF